MKEKLEERLMQLAKEGNILRINADSYEEAIEVIERYKKVLQECSLPEEYYGMLK